MSAFKSSRFFPYAPPDLAPVAEQVMREFRGRGYETAGQESVTGDWLISLHKGGMFKAVVGMKTALNIELEPQAGGTQVNAGIGIFGQQFLPTIISMLVFWPVLVTQIAGMVQNAKLDDEALRVVEEALKAHAGIRNGGAVVAPVWNAEAGRFCTECGTPLPEGANFCLQCGAKMAVA